MSQCRWFPEEKGGNRGGAGGSRCRAPTRPRRRRDGCPRPSARPRLHGRGTPGGRGGWGRARGGPTERPAPLSPARPEPAPPCQGAGAVGVRVRPGRGLRAGRSLDVARAPPAFPGELVAAPREDLRSCNGLCESWRKCLGSLKTATKAT